MPLIIYEGTEIHNIIIKSDNTKYKTLILGHILALEIMYVMGHSHMFPLPPHLGPELR